MQEGYPQDHKFTEQIFMGSGTSTERDIEVLHGLVDNAVSHLSGIQQGGLFGTDYPLAMHMAEKAELREKVAEIALALTGEVWEPVKSTGCQSCGNTENIGSCGFKECPMRGLDPFIASEADMHEEGCTGFQYMGHGSVDDCSCLDCTVPGCTEKRIDGQQYWCDTHEDIIIAELGSRFTGLLTTPNTIG